MLFGVGVIYAPKLDGIPVFNNMVGAIFPLFLMLLFGTLLLLKVDVEKGRQQAKGGGEE